MITLAVIPGEDPGSMQPKLQAEWIPAFAGMTERVGFVPSHHRWLQ